jgi:hypothetical protein
LKLPKGIHLLSNKKSLPLSQAKTFSRMNSTEVLKIATGSPPEQDIKFRIGHEHRTTFAGTPAFIGEVGYSEIIG